MTVIDAMPSTRAVVRPVEAGAEDIFCPADRGGCGGEVKFQARVPSRFRLRVVSNVYFHGRWDRVEIFHCLCYVRAGMPYGPPASGIKDELLQIMQGVCDANPDASLLELNEALVDEVKLRGMGTNISASDAMRSGAVVREP